MDFLASLYTGRDPRDAAIFRKIGKFFHPPSEFSHGRWHLIASLPKDPQSGDGHPVNLYESRMPARFFKVEVLPAPDSTGEMRPGFALSTGSGDEMGRLCVELAIAATQGMINLAREGE